MGEAVTKRLLATVAFIALFHILGLVPMPTVDKGYLQSVAGAERRVNVTALGIRPWVTGFLFVELWSFAFRRGRQLRRAGTAGRRRLNAFSVRAGIVFAAIQAAGVAIALTRTRLLVWESPFGLAVTDLTFVAGSVLVFVLAQAVSRWGLGNGVCLFLILPIVEALIQFYRASALSGLPVLSGLETLLGLAGVGLLVKMFMRGPVVVLSDNEKREIPSTFSAFPQGLVPVSWTYSVFIMISTFALISDTTGIRVPRTPVLEVCTAVLIVAMSFCTFHLFSSRRRLDSSLPAGALPPGAEPSPGRWLIPTTALLVVFGTVLNDRGSFLGLRLGLLPSFFVLVMLVAFVLDLVTEIRFRLKCGTEVAPVIEMDNVHGVSYLRGILATHGIDSMARAFHYRSLFYFLEPIVKMELLVPAAEMAQAQEIIRAEKIEVV